jgi:hypothetical protein
MALDAVCSIAVRLARHDRGRAINLVTGNAGAGQPRMSESLIGVGEAAYHRAFHRHSSASWKQKFHAEAQEGGKNVGS